MMGLSLDRYSPMEVLSQASTTDEVTECLNQLACEANQSVASALKAQIQVIKYISKPDLCGSAFDLFFKNLKKALAHCDNEENAYEIREKAGLMLNNFIFFTKAKIEWELLVRRKEGEKLFIHAAQELAQSICEIALLHVGGAAKVGIKTVAIKNIRNLLFNPDEHGDNWFKKAARWLFKSSRTATKHAEFAETLDRLADKLIKYRDVIGPNDLIAGIYENYYTNLMNYHSYEWISYEVAADEKLEISWQAPLFILGIGSGISAIVWFVRWIISLFSSSTAGWAATQWIWTAVILVSISLVVFVIFLILYTVKRYQGYKIKKMYADYYTSIQDAFTE